MKDKFLESTISLKKATLVAATALTYIVPSLLQRGATYAAYCLHCYALSLRLSLQCLHILLYSYPLLDVVCPVVGSVIQESLKLHVYSFIIRSRYSVSASTCLTIDLTASAWVAGRRC